MKIDKNVYMPKQGKNQKIATKMEVGDSVLFKTRQGASNLQTTLKRIGLKGITRTVQDGYRTWRIQ